MGIQTRRPPEGRSEFSGASWAARPRTTATKLRNSPENSVRISGGKIVTRYKAVGIEGYGRSEQEALESFADVFSATWDWIATARDSELGGEARELKRELRALVAAVEAA